MNEFSNDSDILVNIYKEDELGEKSEKIWVVAEPVLKDWQQRLTNFGTRHHLQISKTVEEFAGLFGKKVPEKLDVDLHFMAQKDSSKGEPASGLVDLMLLPDGGTDVFYWLGEVTRLPNDGQKELEEEERRVTVKVIHEEIHQEFQRNNPVFLDVLKEVDGDEEIIKMRVELMKNQLGYLEPEAELVAIYLEQYANCRLQEDVSNESIFNGLTVEYRVDEKRFHEITKAVIRENNTEKWKNGGPYKKLVDGWREIYGSETRNIELVGFQSGPSQKAPDELSIYELGEKIVDFSLVERYILEGKRFDLVFMKELYKIFLDIRGT